MSAELTQFLKEEILFYGGFRTTAQNVYIAKLQLIGADPATAANFNTFDILPVAATLTKVFVRYSNVGSSGATLQLERIQGTEANGAGDALLASALSLTATANTLYTPALVTTNVVNFSAGDSIGAIDAGTLTNLANLIVVCIFRVSSTLF